MTRLARLPSLALAVALVAPSLACAQAPTVTPTAGTPDLDIVGADVVLIDRYELLVFEQRVAGTAGAVVPEARGQTDEAPVLGYVFPTSLSPQDVGFAAGEGVVALVAASHPDFDDTPLWDEDMDRDYSNDGARFHTHWAVLVPDERVAGGLAVKETQRIDQGLPPTNAGMPMYLDSPGFSVVLQGDAIRIMVPVYRVSGQKEFSYDAVTAYLEVNLSDESRPLLGVYEVYDVLSGDLSLPYRVRHERD